MKKGIRKLNMICVSLLLCLSLSVTVFAKDGIKYSNDPTVTPIRIFFAILVVILFVITEIVFEKIRNKRITKRKEKRNK